MVTLLYVEEIGMTDVLAEVLLFLLLHHWLTRLLRFSFRQLLREYGAFSIRALVPFYYAGGTVRVQEAKWTPLYLSKKNTISNVTKQYRPLYLVT